MDEMILEGILWVINRYVLSMIEYPGAFIHWQLCGRKATFEHMVKRWFGVNLLLSFLLYGLIAWLVTFLCY